MNWLSNLFSGIGGIGNWLGQTAYKGLSGVGKGVGQAISPISNIFGNLFGGGGGGQNAIGGMFQGGKGSGYASGISQAMPQAQNVQGPMSPVGQNIMSWLNPPNKPISTAFKSPGGQNVSTAMRGFTGQLFQPQQALQPAGIMRQAVNTALPNKGGGASGGGTQNNQGTMGILSSLFGQNPTQTLGGLGVSMLGQGIARTPKMPDLTQLPSYQLMKNIQVDPQVVAAAEADLKKQEAEQEREFISMWKNLRPGSDIESDSVFRRDFENFKAKQLQNHVNYLAQVRQSYIQSMMSQLEAQYQAEAGSALGQFGMDAQEKQNLQNLFGQLGGGMMQQGLGLNNTDWLRQMFQEKGATD